MNSNCCNKDLLLVSLLQFFKLPVSHEISGKLKSPIRTVSKTFDTLQISLIHDSKELFNKLFKFGDLYTQATQNLPILLPTSIAIESGALL